MQLRLLIFLNEANNKCVANLFMQLKNHILD